MGTPMTFMGSFDDIHGNLRGHYWDISRTLMGVSRTLVGKVEDINGKFR